MKKTFLFAALLPMLAACSNDEVVSTTGSDEISVSVTTEMISRASELHSSLKAELPGSFLLSAAVAKANPSTSNFQAYFENETVTRAANDNVGYCELSHKRYWPQNQNLDFFAYHETSTTKTPTVAVKKFGANYERTMTVEGVTIQNAAEDQDDILYAVSKDVSKPDDGVLHLNFRHALSQLVFQVQNQSSTLYVEVQNATLCNVYKKGDLKCYSSTSKQYITNDNGLEAQSPNTTDAVDDIGNCIWDEKGNQGEIKVLKTETDDDIISMFPVKTDASAADPTIIGGTDNKAVLLTIPDAFTKGSISNDATNGFQSSGVYVKLSCRIYNISKADDLTGNETHKAIAGDDDTAGKGVALYTGSADAFKDLLIPLPAIENVADDGTTKTNIGWQAGRKYVYTFIFTDDSGNNSYDETGKDAFVPIEVKITCDDWATGSTSDVDTDI